MTHAREDGSATLLFQQFYPLQEVVSLVVQSDPSVRVVGSIGRDRSHPEETVKIVKVQFHGGFIPAKRFLQALYRAEDGEQVPSGWANIAVSVQDDYVTLLVTVPSRDIAKFLSTEVCDEVEDRIRLAEAMLVTYDDLPPLRHPTSGS